MLSKCLFSIEGLRGGVIHSTHSHRPEEPRQGSQISATKAGGPGGNGTFDPSREQPRELISPLALLCVELPVALVGLLMTY